MGLRIALVVLVATWLPSVVVNTMIAGKTRTRGCDLELYQESPKRWLIFIPCLVGFWASTKRSYGWTVSSAGFLATVIWQRMFVELVASHHKLSDSHSPRHSVCEEESPANTCHLVKISGIFDILMFATSVLVALATLYEMHLLRRQQDVMLMGSRSVGRLLYTLHVVIYIGAAMFCCAATRLGFKGEIWLQAISIEQVLLVAIQIGLFMAQVMANINVSLLFSGTFSLFVFSQGLSDTILQNRALDNNFVSANCTSQGFECAAARASAIGLSFMVWGSLLIGIFEIYRYSSDRLEPMTPAYPAYGATNPVGEEGPIHSTPGREKYVPM